MASDEGPTSEGAYWGPTFANADPPDSHFECRAGRVHYRRWLPSGAPARARVIGVHGYGDHSGRHHRFGLALNAAGVEMWMLDLPGHGRTAPDAGHLGRDPALGHFPALVDCVEDFFAHIRDTADGGKELPFFLFGHSWGGVLAFLAATRPSVSGVTVKGTAEEVAAAAAPHGRGLILSGPAFRVSGNSLAPKPYWALFRGLANVVSTVAPRLPSPAAPSSELTGDAEYNKATDDSPFAFGATIVARTGNQLVLSGMRAREDAAAYEGPLLVVHGTADKICPVYGSEEILAAVGSKDKALRTYDRLKHEVLSERVEGLRVAKDVVDFINARLPPG